MMAFCALVPKHQRFLWFPYAFWDGTEWHRAQIMFFHEKFDFSWKSHFFHEIMHFLAKMQLFTQESPKKHPFRIGFIRPGAQGLEKSHFHENQLFFAKMELFSLKIKKFHEFLPFCAKGWKQLYILLKTITHR